MTVIAEGTSFTETTGPPPRKKLCLSLSGKGRTISSSRLSLIGAQDTMSVTVNRLDGNKNGVAKKSVALRPGNGSRRDGLTGPVETGLMLNGYVSESVNSIPASDDSPTSDSPPVATLCNLGNTCFLNSILYTLRFAPCFLHNLHHLVTDLADVAARHNSSKAKSSSLGRSIGVSSKPWTSDRSAIQVSSDTSTKSRIQLATERLHEVYEALHNAELKDSSEPFQPDDFLHALREVNPMFEGNQQHDAHELLGCLLNYIRDTCTDLAKQLETQPILNSDMSTSALSVEEVKKESKGSLLSHVGLSTSTSSIGASVRLGGLRKSWKRKKAPTNSLQRTSLSVKNGSSSVIENGNQSRGQPIRNGLVSSQNDSSPELRVLANGEVSHGLVEGDVGGKMNGSCILGPLPEADESDGTEGLPRKVGLNFIAEDFEGVMILRTTCLECECMTEMKETFCEIGVPIQTEQDSEISDASEQVSALYRASIVTEELLHNVNKYWCEHCLRYNEARRSVRYQTLPRLLTLQLKRFSSTFGSMVCMSKVNDYMPTPLVLECFCEECMHLQGKQAPTKHRYQLYGVIMHLGATIASGHYVAYVRAADPTVDYRDCDRDKRKTASLIATGSSKALNTTDGEKNRGILRFFSKSKTNATDAVSKNNLNNPYYRNICRSLDCCGVRVNSINASVSLVNGCAGDGQAVEDPVEPSWLECDDETVRVLTKKQLEDVLAPKQAKSSALTPYLLFYVRDP